jgi:hypothetical protein
MNANSSESVLLLQYGLKTHRQKRRAVLKDRDKQLIGLYKKWLRIRNDIQTLGWDELKNPYQSGWKRSFVLREDVAVNKNATFYRNLLQKINTIQYSPKKDFLKKKRVYRKRVYMQRKQSLREFYHFEMHRVKLSKSEFEMFVKVDFHDGKSLRTKYVFSEPWRFVLKVEPNIITKTRKDDPLLKSNLDQLNNYLRGNDLENRMTKLRNGSVHWWGRKLYDLEPREFDALRNQTLTSILDEHWYNK